MMTQTNNEKFFESPYQPLMYKGYSIVFQEVPDEVALAINISGCQHHCPGCHSKYLWNNDGALSLKDDFVKLLKEYKDFITCICFMGGDQNPIDLTYFLSIARCNGLKTCLYTGATYDQLDKRIVSYLDYLKVGPFIEQYGGLHSPTTNQRFYSVFFNENTKEIDLKDRTYLFNQEKR